MVRCAMATMVAVIVMASGIAGTGRGDVVMGDVRVAQAVDGVHHAYDGHDLHGVSEASRAQDVPPGAGKAPASAAEKTAKGQVNVNTASASELEELPGVGPSLAARIVEYRQKNGGFKKVDDLMNVRGIGEKSFLKLKPFLTITPAKGGGA